MTRYQQRLAARYERALCTGTRDQIQQAQDAIIGDALYRRHQASLTPIDRALQQHGIYETARRMSKQGVHFVDAYCAIFRIMPRLSHIEDRAEWRKPTGSPAAVTITPHCGCGPTGRRCAKGARCR